VVEPVRLAAFYRLDAEIGWRLSAVSEGVRVEPSTGEVELGFVGTRLSPLTDVSGTFGGLTLPTGVAIGPEGVVLVADPQAGVILRNPHPGLFGAGGQGAPGFVPLWPKLSPSSADDAWALSTPPQPGPHDLVRPRGLAFSRDGDLLVADEGDGATAGRLIVYTWPELFVRQVIALDGRPWDVAVDADGRIHLADAGVGRVRRLTRSWQEEAWPGGAGQLHQPKHLAINAEGTVFVVDLDGDTGLNRLSRLTNLGAAEPLDETGLTAFWQARLPPPIRQEGGAFYAPGEHCREHGPRLRNVTVDRRGRLPQRPQLLYVPPPGRRVRKGTFVSEALDSGSFAFAWHRLLFDMELGQAGGLEVQTFTSPQFLEPERITALPEQSWSRRVVLTPESRPEVLIQSPPGRYLFLRVRLVGDGSDSPRVRAIDVLGPRRSSLRFLPRPFHEDPVSRDFLDRFLSYFDTVFNEIEHRIGRFAAQLSPQGAPEGAFLAWLASWFDIAMLAEWPDSTRRAFLANAMKLHRLRGTVAGLKAVLRLHLRLEPPMPALIEGFRLRHFAERRLTGEPDLHDGSLRIASVPLTQPLIEGDTAHRFFVAVPAARVPSEKDRAALRQLVDLFRPAHTAWTLIAVEPGVRVGCQSTIGVDTLLGGYPHAPLGEMRLGQSATLARRPNSLKRLGDARLVSST
jgi:phage tail-like protein